jgi:hypothetical protein
MPALVVQFKSQGLPALQQGVRGLTNNFNQLSRAQAGAGGGLGPAGGAVLGGGGTPGNALVQQARSHRQQAQLINAQLALQNAQQRQNRRNNPPSLFQRLGQAALTTRFNIGGHSGGVSPLIGRSLAALGVTGTAAATIGLLAGAAALAVVAVKAFGDAVQEGAQAMLETRRNALVGGGTGGQAAFLAAMGISGGAAHSLRERIATDPTAMLGAAQLGVRATPGMFGGQNSSAVALKLVDAMRAVVARGGDPTRQARMIGAEDLLPLAYASDKAYASLKKTTEALGALSEQNKGAMSDWEIAVKRNEASNKLLEGALMAKIAPIQTAMNNWASDFNEWAAKILGVKVPGASGGTNPTVANTAAITQLTYLLKATIYGGGSRAAGAIPAGLSGQNLNNMARNNARWISPW